MAHVLVEATRSFSDYSHRPSKTGKLF